MSKTNITIYSVISYVWSYAFWILAFLLAMRLDQDVLLNENFAEALVTNQVTTNVLLVAILALIAVYGPLIGSLVIAKRDPDFRRKFKQRMVLHKNWRMYGLVVAIFVAIGFIPSVPLLFIYGTTSMSIGTILMVLLVFFLIQLVTSGFEEFGWRGYLLPEFLKSNDGWNASFKTGLIWAFWHLPVVLYIFHLQGMPPFAMIFSFVGFSAGIVAMSVVHTYFYLKTESVLFSVFLHATGNTIPLISGLLVANAYQVAIVSQLLIWVLVAILMKYNKLMFS